MVVYVLLPAFSVSNCGVTRRKKYRKCINKLPSVSLDKFGIFPIASKSNSYRNKEIDFRFTNDCKYFLTTSFQVKIIIFTSAGFVFFISVFLGLFEFLFFCTGCSFFRFIHLRLNLSVWRCPLYTIVLFMTSRVGATLAPSQTPLPVRSGR